MNQPIPSMKVNRLGAGVFTIENFLAPSECAEFIAESEALGYEEAAIRTEDGDRLYKDARNNDRIVFDKRELASSLYQRARPLLPAEIKGWFLSGFNERFRFYRYEKQQQFVWHQDGTVRLSETEESLLTFMIYLNDEFEGGSTDFGWEAVRPVQGMALAFPHRLRHQGSVVTGGVKYVLRTDVMYAGNA
jgi:predicted 2-oxoglutarate/Fe(II)-dependent dioxygenase YbiX